MRRLPIWLRGTMAALLGGCVMTSCAGTSRDASPSKAPAKGAPEGESDEEEEEEESPSAFAEFTWWDSLFDEFNVGEFDKAAARFSEPIAARTIGMPEPDSPTRANLVAGWQQARAMLPDNKMRAERVFVVKNVAYAQIITVGTHTGEIEGFEASGNSVGWLSLFRFEFSDEELTEDLTIYTNPLVFAEQVQGYDTPVPALPEVEETPVIAEAGDTGNSALVKIWFASIGEGAKSMRKTLKETFADDVVIHETAAGTDHTGHAWLRSYMEEELSVSEEHDQSFLEVHSVGDFVIVHGIWKARRTRRMPGVGGRGKEYEYDFAQVYRFVDRKVSEVWWYQNPQQVIDQLADE